jgi:iron complex transport system substrate-binding protein
MKSIICSVLLLLSVSSPCLAAPPQRIVSLAPSVTELVCALGLERNLVGVTSFCDRPASVRGTAVVGGPANPSLEAILSLKPDLVVVDDEGIGPRVADRLERLGVRTARFHGTRLAVLPAGIRQLGRDLGVPEAAERLAAAMARAIRPVPLQSRAPKVLFVIWPDPLVTAGSGTLLDDALRAAGMANCADGVTSPYPRLSLEAVLQRQPELLVVGPGHARQFPMAALRRRLAALPAIQHGRICYVSDALYRPGPRIAEGIAELRRCADRYVPRVASGRQGGGS